MYVKERERERERTKRALPKRTVPTPPPSTSSLTSEPSTTHSNFSSPTMSTPIFKFLEQLGFCSICHESAKNPVRPICKCHAVYCRDCAYRSWTEPRMIAVYSTYSERSQKKWVKDEANTNREGQCPNCHDNLITNHLSKHLTYFKQACESITYVTDEDNIHMQEKYENLFELCFVTDRTLVDMQQTIVTCPDDNCKDKVYGNTFMFMMHLIMAGHLNHFPDYDRLFEVFDKQRRKISSSTNLRFNHSFFH